MPNPQREQVDIYDLLLPPFAVWDKTWFLLTAGTLPEKSPAPTPPSSAQPTPRSFNSMTVSWGGLGFMWGKPLAIVVVRPQRHTFEYLDKSPDFTLCAFGESHRATLNFLGTKSGKEIDKLALSGLTPIPGGGGANSPAFDQAELILACRKTYWQDLDPKHFLADYIDPLYRSDYHRIFFGEVLAVQATPNWRRPR
jgi:flavin reductase (DIM6/NTAB) family NADH-FMN oxidoreductase RutF